MSPHRQSDTTVDGGLDGLREYTVLKQINLAMTPERSGWFAGVEDESKGGERLGE